MSEKKQESFTVTDRRLFTPEARLRREVTEEEVSTAAPAAAARPPRSSRSRGAAESAPAAPPAPLRPNRRSRPTPTASRRRARRPGRTQRPLRERNGDDLRALHGFALHDRHAAARPDAGGRRTAASRFVARARPSTLWACWRKRPRAISPPRKKTFCRTASTNLRMAYVEVTNALARPPQARPGQRNPCETMKATLTVLGSGTSMGVPTIGCDCAVCRSSDPHDRRTRPSILLRVRRQKCAHRYHS